MNFSLYRLLWLKKNLPGKTPAPRPSVAVRPVSETVSATVKSFLLPFQNVWLQGFVLILTAILLYANTLGHQYAVDDYIVILENEFTKKGFAGIKDHFLNDSFTGFFGKRADALLEGGRYRPLSLVTFAIEWQFFGKNPELSHAVNVLLYALLVFLIWDFLRETIFRKAPEFAFWSAFIFALHPLHTEVVANIKGRDELLSLILLTVSTRFGLRYFIRKDILALIIALSAYFFALLAKENGFTWFVIFPLTLYFFTNVPKSKYWVSGFMYLGVLLFYFAIRIKLTGPIFGGSVAEEILNSPYLNASFIEKYGTIVWILGKYLLMFFYPHPLAWDYSFNQIAYKNLSDPTVWMALVSVAGILVYAFIRLPKKDPIAYGILFYYFSLFLSSNILVNIGAFMADRFLFQPSLGFAIVIGVLLQRLSESDKKFSVPPAAAKGIAGSLLAYALIFGSYKTFSRNTDWQSNETLYPNDVSTVPGSAKANLSAGEAYMHMAGDTAVKLPEAEKNRLFGKAFEYYDRALKIYPNFNDAYLRKIITLIMMKRYDETEEPVRKARELYPDNTKLKLYIENISAHYFERSVKMRIKSFDFLNRNQKDSAEFYLQKAINDVEKSVKINPEFSEGYKELGNYYGFLKDYTRSFQNFEKALQLDPNNAEIWYNAGVSYLSGGKKEAGVKALQKSLQLSPNGSLAGQAQNILKQEGALK